jgi:hypothetical protein
MVLGLIVEAMNLEQEMRKRGVMKQQRHTFQMVWKTKLTSFTLSIEPVGVYLYWRSIVLLYCLNYP